ncbi:unnamed protein product [Spodoptera exigua]|nr:unnamed protein product [Spodoptera exigua]
MYITRFRTKRIAAYVGIPYAQPPIEFRRFLPPEYTDLPQWEGVRNATIYAPDCMQSDPKKEDVQNPLKKHDDLFMKLLDSQLEEKRKKEYSEDCLFLNVYVPDVPREGAILLLPPQPPQLATLRASGIKERSPATVSTGLRLASKGSSPPDQNQARAYGA